ncbi:hypothetical protein AKJ48_02890 [candidate division MSBL1 archaeon SCGC-AAA261O19]|uniref:Uncharacterized protein n=1 Tax=candidate division MSBL1 archaeon SCGC-AAA261O19 TaxID=1698277 RepID=A0A133VD51_9EURY|nr:hypothetical protein AKJ48_02890 [candidate division MSBL1 archaeon SCGC-AAA261O19]
MTHSTPWKGIKDLLANEGLSIERFIGGLKMIWMENRRTIDSTERSPSIGGMFEERIIGNCSGSPTQDVVV